MTVSSQTSVVQYNGNGATVTWPTTFRFFKNTDLVVTKRSAAGATTLLALNSDYSVTGANALAGGSVTTTNALAAGELLTIARVLNVQQLTDLRNQGDYFAEIHEDVFDYLTMLIQQTGESDSRALRHPRDSEHYQAEARRIVDMEDPVNPQDATTKNWVSTFFAGLIDSASGLINTTTGILYDAGTLFDYLRFGLFRSVDTVSDLRLLTPARNQRAFILGALVKGDGGHGAFAWNAGNFATLVAADPKSGLYVAPSTDLTGASGAWVRIREQYRPVPEWWGRSAAPAGVNTTNLPISLLKNRAGATQDQWVLLFGDSHSWGQGAPDSQVYTTAGNVSVHSANIHNRGYMRRISDDISQRRGFFPCSYGAWTSTYPVIGIRPGFYGEDAVERSKKDPNMVFPLIPLAGKVIGGLVPLASIGSLTDQRFYSPAAINASYTFLYREKLARGLFGLPLLTLTTETVGEFQEQGKTEFIQLAMNPARVSSGAGFTAYTNPSGGIYAERNTATNDLYISTVHPATSLPAWIGANGLAVLPGYGLVRIASVTATNGGTTLGITTPAGAALGNTGALACLRDGLRLYHPAYLQKCICKVPMQSAARAMYVAVRHKPGGGILNFYFTDNIGSAGSGNAPYFTASPARFNSNDFEWVAGANAAPVVAGPNGALSITTKATLGSSNYQIDTSPITAGVTEEVVYRIDFGATQIGDLFIESTGACDIRGVIFDNNKVVNLAMGGHTIGAWMGLEASFSAETADHVGQILNHVPVQPSHVITQIPFVNEYLYQTPIATFQARLLTFINRFKNHIPGSNNFNAKGVDFTFFTTIRYRATAWEGSGELPVTYDMYVQAAKDFCAANGCAFIDVEAALFTEVRSGKIDYQRLYNDENHPSDYANELIYRELKKTIEAIV